METITFKCETITPMFMAGADGITPEVRVPSIKGALRFWWRAIHGNLNLKELKDKEETIFGGTNVGGRSKIILLLTSPQPTRENCGDFRPTPHSRTRNFSKPGITPNFEFTLKVRLNNSGDISIEQVKNLFIIFSILGGLGNRSRRGFGAFYIRKINEADFSAEITKDYILSLIQSVVPGFVWQRKYKNEYPILLDVQLGRDTDENEKNIVRDFGQATHDLKEADERLYEEFVGSAKKRFASPVYLSAFSNKYGQIQKIASILKTVNDNASNRYLSQGLRLQADLIKTALS